MQGQPLKRKMEYIFICQQRKKYRQTYPYTKEQERKRARKTEKMSIFITIITILLKIGLKIRQTFTEENKGRKQKDALGKFFKTQASAAMLMSGIAIQGKKQKEN